MTPNFEINAILSLKLVTNPFPYVRKFLLELCNRFHKLWEHGTDFAIESVIKSNSSARSAESTKDLKKNFNGGSVLSVKVAHGRFKMAVIWSARFGVKSGQLDSMLKMHLKWSTKRFFRNIVHDLYSWFPT